MNHKKTIGIFLLKTRAFNKDNKCENSIEKGTKCLINKFYEYIMRAEAI